MQAFMIPRSKAKIYECLSRDADTAFISMCILIFYGVYVYGSTSLLKIF